MKPPQSNRGRPPLPNGEGATSQIQLRVQTKRKAAYVRAANKKRTTLAAWMFETCDAASGYREPDSK